MKKTCIILWLLAVAPSATAEESEPRLDDPVEPKKNPVQPAQPSGPLVPDDGRVEKEGETHFGKIAVVGSRQVIRGGIASIAENLRVELNKITGEAGRRQKLPIIIRLYGKVGEEERKRSVVSEIVEIQGHHQLRLHIHLAKGVDHDLLRYHLMELFLYERGLGDGQKVAEGERVIVKPWLVVGMLEALAIKKGEADKKIYQTDQSYFKILPLQEVFDASESEWRDLEGRQPLAFRAISGALVSALLRQPDGRPSMGKYLADVATFKGEVENLMRKHFPGMNKSRNSLEKWVDLEMAELGTSHMTEVYSIAETDKRLESILKLRYRDDKKSVTTVGIDGYKDILKLEPAERFTAVAGARAELERLSYRCFPSYRPLLSEYEMILRDVITGKDKDISVRLEKLTDIRMKLQEAGKRVRDYLDWFYITQSNEVGGDFKQYRELSDALQREALRPGGDDVTEKYLDQIQQLFGGE
ncbi:hypothetical protein NT6N_05250 [Oceaniferula spumae]|uniref:Uncharacterized protein n=1 Tax=Oceaniferula spumae TaxID=2979115 RepID=A0AAT9FHQ2_9BACT